MASDRPPLKPSPLRPGSRVALIAPGFTFRAERLEAGIEALRSRYGLDPAHLPTARDRDGYFAGNDERRLEELYHWLTDPQTDALFAIRGGYGCARVYPALLERLRRAPGLKPKIVLGYSDLTILLNGLFQDLGWIAFHGPVLVGHFFQQPPSALEERSFHGSLFSAAPPAPIAREGTAVLWPGTARGRLVGGNLSLIVSSLGTPYEIRADDRILFLEDIGERPYRIDRMLTQLVHAGKLDRVRGIVLGRMEKCDPPPIEEFGHETPDVIEAIRGALAPLLKRRRIPVIHDFPAGHGPVQATLPLGCEVELAADGSTPGLRFLEPACAAQPG